MGSNGLRAGDRRRENKQPITNERFSPRTGGLNWPGELGKGSRGRDRGDDEKEGGGV